MNIWILYLYYEATLKLNFQFIKLILNKIKEFEFVFKNYKIT